MSTPLFPQVTTADCMILAGEDPEILDLYGPGEDTDLTELDTELDSSSDDDDDLSSSDESDDSSISTDVGVEYQQQQPEPEPESESEPEVSDKTRVIGECQKEMRVVDESQVLADQRPNNVEQVKPVLHLIDPVKYHEQQQQQHQLSCTNDLDLSPYRTTVDVPEEKDHTETKFVNALPAITPQRRLSLSPPTLKRSKDPAPKSLTGFGGLLSQQVFKKCSKVSPESPHKLPATKVKPVRMVTHLPDLETIGRSVDIPLLEEEERQSVRQIELNLDFRPHLPQPRQTPPNSPMVHIVDVVDVEDEVGEESELDDVQDVGTSSTTSTMADMKMMMAQMMAMMEEQKRNSELKQQEMEEKLEEAIHKEKEARKEIRSVILNVRKSFIDKKEKEKPVEWSDELEKKMTVGVIERLRNFRNQQIPYVTQGFKVAGASRKELLMEVMKIERKIDIDSWIETCQDYVCMAANIVSLIGCYFGVSYAVDWLKYVSSEVKKEKFTRVFRTMYKTHKPRMGAIANNPYLVLGFALISPLLVEAARKFGSDMLMRALSGNSEYQTPRSSTTTPHSHVTNDEDDFSEDGDEGQGAGLDNLMGNMGGVANLMGQMNMGDSRKVSSELRKKKATDAAIARAGKLREDANSMD